MKPCPHKEIVAFATCNEYGMSRRSGWHCSWCHTEFTPKPEADIFPAPPQSGKEGQ